MSLIHRVLLAASALMWSACAAAAQGPLWLLPDNVVAYWAFDPGPLRRVEPRDRALVAAGFRGLLDGAVRIEGGTSVAGAVAREGQLQGSAYRVCLLELEGESIEPRDRRGERMVRPTKFAAVIEVRGGAVVQDRLRATVEAALLDDAQRAGGRPRQRKEVELPGGIKAQVSEGDSSWREVAWASTAGSFVVGFGRGSLEQWLTPATRQLRDASWYEQRAVVNRARGKGPQVFEAFVDLNALRRGIPDEFGGGRLGELVHAWRIANARTFMVHAKIAGEAKDQEEGQPTQAGPRLLAIDLSWSQRSEPPGTFHTLAVSASEWPAGLEGAPTGESWALVVRSGVPGWVDLAAQTYIALGGGPEFSAARSRWERRSKPILERVMPRMGEWAVLRPGLNLTLTLRRPEGQDRLAADLRALFSSLAPSVATEGKGWTLTVPEAEEPLRGLMWRVDGDAIVTEWPGTP